MLKRLIVVSSALMLATSANASPEAAEDWGTQASALYRTTATLLEAVSGGQETELSGEYTRDLARFSATAGRLAIWVDTSGGAKDFGCIYRGMAEEAELQLYALEEASERVAAKSALTRIATMLDDAQSIAVASAHAARNGTSAAPSGHCPASELKLDQYLTLQP